MSNIIRSYQDIKYYVTGQIENYDMSCYDMDYYTLAGELTWELGQYMRKLGFKYGDEMPEIDEKTWATLEKQAIQRWNDEVKVQT